MSQHDAKKSRIDYVSVCDNYEGVGINSVDVVKVDKVIISLFSTGEKKTHVW